MATSFCTGQWEATGEKPVDRNQTETMGRALIAIHRMEAVPNA
jgi:hypothetical protein